MNEKINDFFNENNLTNPNEEKYISGQNPAFRAWAERLKPGDQLPRGKFFKRYDQMVRQILCNGSSLSGTHKKTEVHFI